MNNKTVLITGAANRIGAEITKALHADGFDVVIHYNRSETQAGALVSELNNCRRESAASVSADLLDDGAVDRIIKTVSEFNNRLDVLINNASSFFATPVTTTTREQWDDLVGTNMQAPYFLSQQLLPYLKKQKGCIINITDIHASRPLKDYPVYSAAKAGLTMLTMALARELAPEIRVNGIAPGAIMWPDSLGKETKDAILSGTALGRMGDPGDIADAVRYLINNAGYVTGQILTVDGGRSIRY